MSDFETDLQLRSAYEYTNVEHALFYTREIWSRDFQFWPGTRSKLNKKP
jgi:hypothetical protein